MSQPPKPNKLPSYRHHKASGQAFVHLSGRHIYLGPYGTKLSRDAYDRTVSEWLARGRSLAQPQRTSGTSVAELANAFRKADVIPESSEDEYKAVIRILVRLYGLTPADEFGAVALKVVRAEMVKAGWKRRTCNQRIHNLRRIFKWGVEQQLVSPDGLLAMKAVDPLKKGRTTAPESAPVQPIDAAHVLACVRHMTRTPAAMVQLQMYTGMRAGELVLLRTRDVDTTDGTCWVSRLESHKTAHLGKVREIPLGPQAIDVLRPLLLTDLDAYVFSPARAEAERREAMSKARVTPLRQGNRPGTNRKRRPRKAPGERYDTNSYRKAITCTAARRARGSCCSPGGWT